MKKANNSIYENVEIASNALAQDLALLTKDEAKKFVNAWMPHEISFFELKGINADLYFNILFLITKWGFKYGED